MRDGDCVVGQQTPEATWLSLRMTPTSLRAFAENSLIPVCAQPVSVNGGLLPPKESAEISRRGHEMTERYEFDRFKYAEEKAHELYSSGRKFKMTVKFDVSYVEDGETYVHNVFIVRDLGPRPGRG